MVINLIDKLIKHLKEFKKKIINCIGLKEPKQTP